MATIQIRDIPEAAYEVIRRRAREENRSIQSYMLEHVLEFTSRPTKAEVLAEFDRRMQARAGDPKVGREEIVVAVRAGRQERDADIAHALSQRR